jgi:hypothetical protein
MIVSLYNPGSRLAPVIAWQGTDGIYTLEKEHRYDCDLLGVTIIAPVGFEFDGHSIPPVFHWLLQPHQLSPVAALYHDLDYRFMGQLPPYCLHPYEPANRAQADERYRRIMLMEDVKAIRRKVAYSAVRSRFGERAWGSKKPRLTLRDQP